MIKFKKILKYFAIIFFALITLFFAYFFLGFKKPAKSINWGVNFSQKHSMNLGLDWRENYLAILDDLGARKIKISTYWDFIEPFENKYNFEDLDWQIEEAGKRDAKILLAIGMKTPRWPECHIPEWAVNLGKEKQKEHILNLLKNIIERYKDKKAIFAWQVENEIFFPFGNCPWRDKKFLAEEVAFVKLLDNTHPVVVSDSGEYSLWMQAAKIGDIVGVTMYKKVWFKEIKSYVPYFLPAVFYTKRYNLIKNLFNKEVSCVELQAEPWGEKLIYDLSLEEQRKSMNLEQFKKNVQFAKETGLKEFYFWGAEWWYWLKVKHNQAEIWEEAKKLFK